MRLPTGAVAGIGVGCAVTGALVALIICYLVFRQTKKTPKAYITNQYEYDERIDVENMKGSQTTSTTALDDIPLERADDGQIQNSMQSLNELIEQHVENHFHENELEGEQSELEAELTKCGYDEQSQPSANAIVALLVAPKTRKSAIRQLIAKVVVRGMLLSSAEETGLLPTFMLGAFRAMSGARRCTGDEQAMFTKSFTNWRRLTAFLITPSSTSPHTNAALQSAIQANITLLNCTLQPFLSTEPERLLEQREHLASILAEASRFGMLIFSQPSLWHFSWDLKRNVTGGGGGSVRRRAGGLVVWPGIGEVLGRDGRQSLRVVSEAVVVVDVERVL